jgi:hypothetical protein
MWQQLSTLLERGRRRLEALLRRTGPAMARGLAVARAAWRRSRPVLRAAGVLALAALREVWQVVRGPLIGSLEIAAALVLIFEEWGWRPLAAFLSSLTRFRLWARLELMIAGLPPYGALLALAIPTAILFPLKFVALYLLAKGQAFAASALFVAAKIASTALIARLLILTKPALMRIAWFARAYDWLVPWQEAMFALIRASWVWRYGRMVKSRVGLAAKRAWGRWGPVLARQWARLRDRARVAWIGVKPRMTSEVVRIRIAARRAWARLNGVSSPFLHRHPDEGRGPDKPQKNL